MTQAEFWGDPDLAERYAAIVSDPLLAWYERGVNLPSVIGLIPPWARRILDFGCGPGANTATLAERFDTVEGIDTSEPMLALARKMYPSLRFINWDFQTSTGKDIGPYDAITAMQVVEYIDDLPAFASSMRGILSARGSLILSLLHPSCTTPFVPSYWQTTQFRTPVSEYRIHPFLIHRSQEKLLGPFVNAGFVLREIVEPQPSPEQITPQNTDPELYSQPIRLNVRLEQPPPTLPTIRPDGRQSLQRRLGFSGINARA